MSRATPAAVPGTIEAEDFDEGGEGIAYHDNVPGNAGGEYRLSEDVDVKVSTDAAGWLKLQPDLLERMTVNNWSTRVVTDWKTQGDYRIILSITGDGTNDTLYWNLRGDNVANGVLERDQHKRSSAGRTVVSRRDLRSSQQRR